MIKNKLANVKKRIDYFLNQFNPIKGFYFHGRYYDFFNSTYNKTWQNERCVELPIFKEFIEGKENEILEIGNVLGDYFMINHKVIDLYEKAEGVLNENIETYKVQEKYDLIIAISTMEHVKDPEKAIKNILSMLNPKGRFIFSCPVGYSKRLDLVMENYKGANIEDIKLNLIKSPSSKYLRIIELKK